MDIFEEVHIKKRRYVNEFDILLRNCSSECNDYVSLEVKKELVWDRGATQ
jgi:hypothetical protein